MNLHEMVECDNTPDGPTLTWVYSSALHRPQTIEAWRTARSNRSGGCSRAPPDPMSGAHRKNQYWPIP